MARTPHDCCVNCSAWLPIGDGFGYCQAHPPLPTFGAHIKQPGSGVPDLVYVWPITPEFEWCREFQKETPAP